MNDVFIQYQGFHPTDFTRADVDSAISTIYAESPILSSIRAAFKRKKGIISATVLVQSRAGQFFATARGTQIQGINRMLIARVRKHWKRWERI